MEKITELLGHKLVKVYVGHLTDKEKTLLQEKLFSLGCVWGMPTQATCTIRNLHGTWYYIGCDDNVGRLGFDTAEVPFNHTYKTATELTYDEVMGRLNMTFTKADLKTGMVVKYRGGNSYADKYNGLSLVVGDILMQADEYGQLSTKHDNLLSDYKPDFDIVEVFEVVSAKSLETITNWQLNSIWKRAEPISAQQQAILDLEVKQQELIEQAEKIKADILKLKGM